jgi:hypothetical protein
MRESEEQMERLISLFREPREEDGWPGSQRNKPQLDEGLGLESADPLYFQDLLEYLREQYNDDESANSGNEEVCDA